MSGFRNFYCKGKIFFKLPGTWGRGLDFANSAHPIASLKHELMSSCNFQYSLRTFVQLTFAGDLCNLH